MDVRPTFYNASLLRASANVSVVTASCPQSTAAGRLLIASVGMSGTSLHTYPAGWTKGTEVATLGWSASVGYKWSDGTENTSTTVVVSGQGAGGAGFNKSAVIYQFANVWSRAAVVDSKWTYQNSNNFFATPSAQAMTGNCLLAFFGTKGDDVANATPANFTLDNSQGTTTGSDSILHLYTRTDVVSGSWSNPGSASQATSMRYASIAVSLEGIPIWNSTQNDTLIAIDGTLAFKRTVRRADDTLYATDQRLSGVLEQRLMTDNVGPLFNANVKKEWLVTVNESLAAIDALLKGGQTSKIVSDSFIVSDNSFRSLRLVRTQNDGFIVSDDSLRSLRLTREQLEALTLNDGLLRARYANVRMDDGVSLADALLRQALRNRVLDDTLTLIDDAIANLIPGGGGGGPITVVKDDGFYLSDASGKSLRLTRQQTESLVLNDAYLRAKYSTIMTTDGISLADAVLQSVLRYRVLGDVILLGDTLTKTALLGRVLSDSLGLADSTQQWRLHGRVVTDGLPLYDADFIKSIVSGGGIITRVRDSTIVLFDNFTYNRQLNRLHADAFVLTDEAAKFRIRNLFALDTLLVSDAALSSRVRGRTQTDALPLIGDTASPLRLLFRALGDAIVLNDGVLTIRRTVRQLTDALNIADEKTAQFISGLSLTFDVRVILGAEPAKARLGDSYDYPQLAVERFASLGGY